MTTFSLDFEATTSDYCDTAATTLFDGLQKITIEAWIKPESQAATHPILTKWIAGDNHVLLTHISSGAQTFALATALDGSATKSFTAAETLNNGTYYHIAFVFDGSQAANGDRGVIYVNGLPVSTTVEASFPANALSPAGTNVLNIGQYNATNYFDGLITQLRAWNTARSAAQILANYNRILPNSTTGLILNYKATEGTGTTMADTSPSGLTATLRNSTAWSSVIPTLLSSSGGVNMAFEI